MSKWRPSIEAIRNAVDYCPDTGEFTWRPRTAEDFTDLVITAEQLAASWNSRHAGKPALAAKAGEYLSGSVLGYRELAHRLAFAIFHGKWPTGEIDHINGDRLDNRISNLRDVPPVINKRNRKRVCTNTSGAMGVRWCGKAGSWVATIGGRGGVRRYLGSFKSFEDALAARKAAEEELDYHPNHGRTSHG